MSLEQAHHPLRLSLRGQDAGALHYRYDMPTLKILPKLARKTGIISLDSSAVLRRVVAKCKLIFLFEISDPQNSTTIPYISSVFLQLSERGNSSNSIN